MDLSVNEHNAGRDSVVATHCQRAKFEMAGTWVVTGDAADPWVQLELDRLRKNGETATWTLSDANNSFERADGCLESGSALGNRVSVTIRLTGPVRSYGMLKTDGD